MQRVLLTLGSVLLLVTIGGQCRGMLAQPRVRPRTTPMTAEEWGKAYDQCVADLGMPVVRAGRTPGLSAGVGCSHDFYED